MAITNAANSTDVIVTSDGDGDQLFQATRQLPRNTPIQYFEITIEALAAKDPVIAVGFAHNKYALINKLPGWETESVAVHSDDGCFFKDGAQAQRNWLYVLAHYLSAHGIV